MTCIVGIATKDRVYIGADRSVSDSEVILTLTRPKVFINNNWLIGYAGTIGTGQLMEFLDLPPHTDNPYKTLRMDIANQLKDIINNTSEDEAADFLMGYGNKLFEFNTSDWSVIEIEETAVGSGAQICLGSLYTSKVYVDANARLMMALQAAIHYSPTCKGPIDILST